MRVNHNWFAVVTVELSDRCRWGGLWGRVVGESAYWERWGVNERRRKRGNLGCVSSCVYQHCLRRSIAFKSVLCVCSAIFGEWGFEQCTHAHVRPPPTPPPNSYTQVMTVILSDRLKSSLLCHVVILVDPLLSYCTTAVVKTWCSCIFVCVCERDKARAKEAPGAAGVNWQLKEWQTPPTERSHLGLRAEGMLMNPPPRPGSVGLIAQLSKNGGNPYGLILVFRQACTQNYKVGLSGLSKYDLKIQNLDISQNKLSQLYVKLYIFKFNCRCFCSWVEVVVLKPLYL